MQSTLQEAHHIPSITFLRFHSSLIKPPKNVFPPRVLLPFEGTVSKTRPIGQTAQICLKTFPRSELDACKSLRFLESGLRKLQRKTEF